MIESNALTVARFVWDGHSLSEKIWKSLFLCDIIKCCFFFRGVEIWVDIWCLSISQCPATTPTINHPTKACHWFYPFCWEDLELLQQDNDPMSCSSEWSWNPTLWSLFHLQPFHSVTKLFKIKKCSSRFFVVFMFTFYLEICYNNVLILTIMQV